MASEYIKGQSIEDSESTKRRIDDQNDTSQNEEPATKKFKEIGESEPTEVVATTSKGKGIRKKKVKSKKYESEPEESSSADEDGDDDIIDEHVIPEGDVEEDLFEEIDTSNIIVGGRRTRGKVIDYKKTLEDLEKSNELPDDDYDDEDDQEFSLPVEN